MLNLQLKFAYKHLLKNITFSLVNLIGLALGITTFLVIIQYVQVEKSFDKHFKDHENIYRISSQKVQDNVPQDVKASAPVVLAPFLSESIPQIQAVTRIHKLDAAELVITIKDQSGREKVFQESRGFHVDASYFDVFETPFVRGDPEGSLADPNTIVLTERLAAKYFGHANPVGREITMLDDFEMVYRITGVVENPPVSSHFKYDFLISFETFRKQRPHWRWTAWDWDYFHTYLKVFPEVRPEKLETQINEAVADQGREVFAERNYSMNFPLQPMTDIHLSSNLGNEFEVNGRGETIGYLQLIALFILLMAWVNYLNLTSVKSLQRGKEVGLRKVVGAKRTNLVMQFLLESMVLNGIAVFLALAIIWLAKPILPVFLGYELPIAWPSASFWALVTGVWLLGSFLSGIYPAFVMANFRPLKALRGNIQSSKGGLGFRRGLLLFQFFITLLLITLVVNVSMQLTFMQNRNAGFDPEQVLLVHGPKLNATENFWQRLDYFRQAGLRHADIEVISGTNAYPGLFMNHIELFKKAHEQRGDADILKFFTVDYDLIDALGLNLLHGRDFDRTRNSELYEVILNETGAKVLGFESSQASVEQPVTLIHSWGAFSDCKVIGVVKDFDNEAMSGVEPVALFLNRPYARWNGIEYFVVRLNTQNVDGALSLLRKNYEEAFPGNHFSYFFLDDQFNRAFESENRFGKVLGLFTGLGIIIAFLGVMGLFSFTLLRRQKELSIRKILGATMSDLLLTLSRQYLWLMALAAVISVPTAFWAIQSWIENFPYRMESNVLYYAGPVVLLFILVLATTAALLRRNANSNPVSHLRAE